MLDELAKKDSQWRKAAFNICKDKMLADDIVQDMYIYFSNKNKTVNDYYVVRKLMGLFIDYIRTNKKTISLEAMHYLEDRNKPFEPNDEEYEILLRFYGLHWREQQLIIEHHVNDKSLRKIEEEFPMINYGHVFRTIRKSKIKILNNGQEN